MRQHPGLSKADLVEERPGSATGSAEMARLSAVASLFGTKTLWNAGYAGTLVVRISPTGGARRRWDARPHHRQIAAATGDAILQSPEAGCDFDRDAE
jgi:hypothetical protein